MALFSMSIDSRDLERGLLENERQQVPVATMWALNETANDVLTHMQDRMKVVFDKPTRFTLNAFQVWRATKSKLEATVQERPSVGARHYLKIEEAGGRRGKTGLESLLTSRLAYEGIIAAAIPAAGAARDAFGNWSKGERNRVLSQLGAQRDSAANETEASRKRNRGKRARYFVPRNGGLAPGVWKRDGKGELSMVLSFAENAPDYTPRLGFRDGAEEIFAARFPEHFRKAFARAMATAG